MLNNSFIEIDVKLKFHIHGGIQRIPKGVVGTLAS